jgi:hypothetical protein
MPVLANDYSNFSYTTNGKAIVKRALRLLGAISSGEEPSGNELTDGIEALNKMLDSWNSENLMVWALEEFSFTTNSRSMSVGPGADLDMPRPGSLERGQVFIRKDEISYPLEPMTSAEWGLVEGLTSSGLPNAFHYDRAVAFASLNFDITPDQTYTLVLRVPTLLRQITSAVATIQLPAGYAEALDYSLAIRLAPEYGKEVPLTILDIATTARAKIQRNNVRVGELFADSVQTCDSGGLLLADINSGLLRRF